MSEPSGGERFYRGAVRVLSLLFVALGILILVVTAANGGGALGFAMGVAFVAVGALRFWLATRIGS